MGNTHDDVATRWVNRIVHPGKSALSSHNLLDRGDRIFSYGSHFEIARILRDRKGNPTAWLLNGNSFSNTTNRHQAAVRGAIARYGGDYQAVTIPHAALEVAGIDLDSVEIIDVQRDWQTRSTITKPSDGTWRWEYDAREASPGDLGGWVNSLTGEFHPRTSYWGEGSTKPTVQCDHDIELPGPWAPGFNWERMSRERELKEAHVRARHGVWDEVSARRRTTGRKYAVSGTNTTWDLVADDNDPAGFVLQREVFRHWLGGSLIRARVAYRSTVKHKDCGGTGVADEPWFTTVYGSPALGPLDEGDMGAIEADLQWRIKRYPEREYLLGWPHMIDAKAKHTECRGCSGRGRVPTTRHRWAYFLSGFDENETRPSYFFCELPPKVKPTTVQEALETLKPDAVKLAEEMGRDVKRQGDIFAIPMPDLTLRDLKAQGGRHVKRPKVIERDGRLTMSGPRPNLLGTNHEATEVVYVGTQTYARGVIRHVPEFRRPDHKQTKIGRDWHLIVKNTVPVGA